MIVSMIKNLIRYVVINAITSDDQDFPIHQIGYLGKTADGMAWYPYGYHANPGPNTLAVCMAVGSNAENRVMFPGSPKDRISDLLPTPLQDGEVLMYHPLTKSYVHFLQDGTIDIDSQANLNIRVVGDLVANVEGNADIDVGGNADIDVGGDTDIDSVGDIEITAPNVNITGDMLITGDVDIQGDLDTTGDALIGDTGTVNLGGTGGKGVARGGDTSGTGDLVNQPNHPSTHFVQGRSANVFAID